MKNAKKMFPGAMVLAVSFALHSNVSLAGVLYPDASENINLVGGEYSFAGTHPVDHSVFLDELKFSLASSGNITATIDDMEFPVPGDPTKKLFDTDFLTLSLFDGGGNFVAGTGVGGTLSAMGLTSGVTYTLAVSGKTKGIFGSIYEGQLNVEAVPLPAALPAFASALAVLGWRRRKSAKTV